MTKLPLEGRRVRIRDWRLDDIERYREFQRPGMEWQRFNGPYYPMPTEEETHAAIDKLEERIRRQEWATPRVALPIASCDDDRLIGRVNRYWQSEETAWLSIGVVIYDETTWGQGIGFEGLGLWSDYIFAAMPDLVRLDMRTWSGNPGMMRLAEKLGYKQEACFRDARIVDGTYYDGIGYGVLRREWQELYPDGFGASL